MNKIECKYYITFLGVGYSPTIIFLSVGELARLTSGIELPGFLVNYRNLK